MAKRKGFFNHVARPEDAEARMRDIEALFVPRRSALQDVPINRIQPNPFQARQLFDAIDELAEAIRAQGFTSRLRIRSHPEQPGYFQMVYGERRLLAAEAAGLSEVPCEIVEHTDDEMIEIGLTENIQREDLHPLDEARALKAIIDARDYTVIELASRLGKSRGYVYNRLSLLSAPEDVQDLVIQRPNTMLAARDLATVSSVERRKELIDGLLTGKLKTGGVRQAIRKPAPPKEDFVHTLTHSKKSGPGSLISHEYRTLREILARWKEAANDEEYRGDLMTCIEHIIEDIEELTEQLQV